MRHPIIAVLLLAACDSQPAEGPAPAHSEGEHHRSEHSEAEHSEAEQQEPTTAEAPGEEASPEPAAGVITGPLDLMNEHRVSDEVVISGQPTAEQIATLSARGVRTVVNLQPPDAPADDEERAAVEAAGLHYVSVTVPSVDGLDAAFADQLERAVEGMEGPTLLHCPNGNASAGVHALLLFLSGASVEDALASYDASGQTAWREPLQARLASLCEAELGGCAEGHALPPPSGEPDPPGRPTDELPEVEEG